jgi:hypothetical protein
MYGFQLNHTFRYVFTEIKTNSKLTDSQFANLLLRYIVSHLKISREEITEKLNLLDSYLNDE